jgi:Flp pilus assembly protein TadD
VKRLEPKFKPDASPHQPTAALIACTQAFPRGCGSASLRVSGARLVKYNASAEQTELGMHRDGPLVTATIALNHRDEYDGGGTLIEALAGGKALAVGIGHVILHPGAVRHGGQTITRGLRYVLVFFIFDVDVIDYDRYCTLRANVRGYLAIDARHTSADSSHACISRPPAKSAQGFLATALRIESKSEHRDDVLQAAVESFRAAIALGASTEAPHVGLGQALLELGRSSRSHAAGTDSAVDALLVAAALAPTNVHSLSMLSTALQEVDRVAEALEFACAAAAADPLSTLAHNNHGLLLAKLGRHADAISEGYNAGLQLDPQDAELLCNMAISTCELGQHQSAAAIFEAALASDPTHACAGENLEALRLRGFV